VVYTGFVANRRQAPVDIVDEHTALIEEAADRRVQSLKEMGEADEGLRLAIKAAFDAGITAGPIKKASGLSESRLYQIRDGRRH
jgi:hypothetical protein